MIFLIKLSRYKYIIAHSISFKIKFKINLSSLKYTLNTRCTNTKREFNVLCNYYYLANPRLFISTPIAIETFQPSVQQLEESQVNSRGKTEQVDKKCCKLWDTRDIRVET